MIKMTKQQKLALDTFDYKAKHDSYVLEKKHFISKSIARDINNIFPLIKSGKIGNSFKVTKVLAHTIETATTFKFSEAFNFRLKGHVSKNHVVTTIMRDYVANRDIKIHLKPNDMNSDNHRWDPGYIILGLKYDDISNYIGQKVVLYHSDPSSMFGRFFMPHLLPCIKDFYHYGKKAKMSKTELKNIHHVYNTINSACKISEHIINVMNPLINDISDLLDLH